MLACAWYGERNLRRVGKASLQRVTQNVNTDGGVRGSMLQTTLENILDYVAKDRLDDVSLSAWRSHHQGYDVEPDTFSNFFVIIRDCAKDTLGESWSAEMEDAWQGLIHAVRDNAKA